MPRAPVLSTTGEHLFVCNPFENRVRAWNVADGTLFWEAEAVREPWTAALSPDGSALWVGNLLPAGPSNDAHSAAAVSVFDTGTGGVSATIELPDGSHSLLGLGFSPDGRFAYVSHVVGRYHVPVTQIERGWVNTNALTVLDAQARRVVGTILLDDTQRGAANPWGVAISPDGSVLAVAHAGIHEVSLIDREGLHERLASVDEGAATQRLGWLGPSRRRLALPVKGPRQLAFSGESLWVSGYFSDAVAKVFWREPKRPVQVLSLGAGSTGMSSERRGEFLFYDAEVTFQHWHSCVSCHPNSRMDGLNWDQLNDGIGNPKNTRSMLLAHATPPTTFLGVRANAELSVRKGFRHMAYTDLPEADAEAVDAYLSGLEPVPSPLRVGPELSAQAELGRELFFGEAGCRRCHPAGLYTNLKRYDVGTGATFDTPSLVEAFRTGPYLHDGRAATVLEVLTVHNPDDAHGRTQALNEAELEALAAFVRSL